MVQVAIRAGKEVSEDWSLIDIQGNLETNVIDCKGMFIGELTFTSNVS